MSVPAWVAWSGAVGITLIVATGRIFEPLRRTLVTRPATRWLGRLLSCSMCLGLWAGVGLGWALGHRGAIDLALTGGALSLLAYTADLALRRLGQGID